MLVVRYAEMLHTCTVDSKQTYEQTIAQSYCTSGCLYIVVSTECVGSDGLLHTACACEVGAFVAYRQVCVVTKNGRHVYVRREPPRTPSDDDFYVADAHAEGITQALTG